MKLFIQLSLTIITGTLQTPVYATLNTDIARGEKVVELPVANKRSEFCILPNHFLSGDYSKKDFAREEKLCSLQRGTTAGVCEKLNSTNPGLNFYTLPEGMSPAILESKQCNVDKAVKYGKYKLSTSCSYTPSIIGYYHLSRILGNIAQVPPSVIRTFDLNQHIQIAKRAVSKTNPAELIHKTWTSLLASLTAGSMSQKRDLLLTNHFDQSYGALQFNPSHEEKYSEFFSGGSDSAIRNANFKNINPIGKLLKNEFPVAKYVKRDFNQKNLQMMIQMRDASEMILLDSLLNQQDRFGNVHYKEQTYIQVVTSSGNLEVQAKDIEDLSDSERKNAFTVKKMLLKDNDCGVTKMNHARQAGLPSMIRHMHPKTYQALLKFAKGLNEGDPSISDFFKSNLLFTATDFDSLRKNVLEVTWELKKACVNGILKQDLDLDDHFSEQPLPQYSCDIAAE